MLTLLFLCSITGVAQDTPDRRLSAEPLHLIDMPTAGMLYHGNLYTSLEFFEEGGLVAGVEGGLFDRMTAGFSYGGTNIIGDRKALFNPNVGFSLRVRLFDETVSVPAFVLGFSSQGKGAYIDSLNRYVSKSPGLYFVASKNFEWLGFLSLHAGFHYSLEDPDNRTLNAFLGVEKTIVSVVSFVTEYDIGFRSVSVRSLDKGSGYFNLGVRINTGSGFTLGLNLKDIIQNQQQFSIGNRTMLIEYSRAL